MNKRILFVDDEKNVLNGLKRSLRSQQKDWDMSFVLGGQSALEMSYNMDFDAVVTDLRMPGIDGLHVVKELKKHHPEIICIILSGHSDEEMIMQSTGVAHQFLAKPCTTRDLINMLTRIFSLKDFLGNKKLQSLVAGMKTIPSMPETYNKILRQLASPNNSLKEIGDTIKQDPAMTAKILQIVNSAFLGLGRHISDTGEAVSLLGLGIVKSLVLSIGIFSQFDEKKVMDKAFSLEKVWQHSLKVADLARRIAVAENAEKEVVDNSFLAGMLHDIGIIILEEHFSEEYGRVRELAQTKGIPMYQAEYEMFGATHAAVGAYLLGLWALDDPLPSTNTRRFVGAAWMVFRH
ncbi:MAG: HDOD domain-containing protein [gamma proteobacterium symbiont of Bathyaustriella thionipta]|nr:HDOD domain-containing protein [gamma proteobacterium symbiont of Bathyaustriella thionipta]MCU7948790.1 HDOD domain-containing protein [gamma proteobacterium symbiont of Bathyaustriella thionipta]MCU7954202.1 HDOD domain-containing protein [gamma proteobacterium symbiont of Bathyaustriella thionipta]MCU7955248.1 HDOD domain-containing protein [gamma proteobacterium symbiont of Bathyaustriella thionipta]MCU7966257.1 HDOD domain-containing protein [gamma proteobacterium symbiont of Bathyaustr